MQAGDFSMHCPECDAQMSAQPTPIDCPSDPLSIYAITKQQQEDYCLYAAHTFSLPLVTLRHFKVYGSMQSLQEPYMRECFGWADGQTSVNQYDKTVAELRTRGLFRKADG